MLAQINRLQKEKDITKVLRKGKGFKEDFLVLKTLNKDSGGPRFGFIISQKVSKKATVRNKIKRRLSELVKVKIKSSIKKSDNLIIASPGLELKDFWEMEEMINNLFKKSGIIK